mmetsp:Transcript_24532/g.45774  ORF Transcript_24532/g.45774 Transcript_24532/m.45774 type:complete len:256 (+) Transcript_24532:371-1138(+)
MAMSTMSFFESFSTAFAFVTVASVIVELFVCRIISTNVTMIIVAVDRVLSMLVVVVVVVVMIPMSGSFSAFLFLFSFSFSFPLSSPFFFFLSLALAFFFSSSSLFLIFLFFLVVLVLRFLWRCKQIDTLVDVVLVFEFHSPIRMTGAADLLLLFLFLFLFLQFLWQSVLFDVVHSQGTSQYLSPHKVIDGQDATSSVFVFDKSKSSRFSFVLVPYQMNVLDFTKLTHNAQNVALGELMIEITHITPCRLGILGMP